MRGNLGIWGTAIFASAVCALMILGALGTGGALLGSSSALSSTAGRSSGTTVTETLASNAATAGVVGPASSSSLGRASPDANGPHPGTLDVYLDASGGSPSVDPSVCYYTVCYEPIMNVYQTLVAYNGSSTATFVPGAATCVPGTTQCTTDYGASPTGSAHVTGFTGMFNAGGGITNGITNGTPVYWTFVLDPAAHFYDATNTTGWPVYPTDVMYSIVRTVGYADLPFVARTPGWIMAQSLLPTSSQKFDVYGSGSSAYPDHYPYNNTPYDVMSSMLINNSTYCPANAIGPKGDGCITFVANGGGEPWSEFLEFIADNLGASIESCAFFSAHGGAVPGLVSHANVHGDGTCTLAGNTNSTDATGFQTYLTSVSPGMGTQKAGTGMYSWDAFQNQSFLYPLDVPEMAGTEIGSGPYWASVSLSSSYGLRVNPSYQQPSGCGGNLAYAQYVGYCEPAPGSYIGDVSVIWEGSDGPGLAAYQAGTADFADISPNHIAQMLALKSSGKINLEQLPAINVFQQSYVTEWNSTERTGYGFAGTNNIPEDFFSYEAARSLLQTSYPYANIENNVWTTDGIKTLFEVGSQLAQGLGCYAPPSTTNGCSNTYHVAFPYLVNGGQVDRNASHVGTAAWWWAQGRNSSSPYYDPELVSCTSTSPCQFSIEGATGAPAQDSANALWVSSIESVTGGALKPNAPDIPASDLLTDCGLAAPGQSACPIYNFGWIADYPDPTDYEGAYGLPSSSYGGPDDLGSLLIAGTHDYNNATCNANLPGASTHLDYSVANLSWWANTLNTSVLPEACQGPAYNIYVDSLNVAASLVGGTSISNQRVLVYDLGATIENALNFYAWIGQQYPIYTAAPWINISSVNTNVVIGAGDAQFWYMIQYRSVYAPTVSETGLAAGTKWSASFGGLTLNSTGAAITFPAQPNGTYNFSVSFVAGYKVSTSNGTVSIRGSNPTTAVTYTAFSPGTLTTKVTFDEVGLVTGTPWSLLITGYGAVSSNTPTLSFVLPQSTTYTYIPQDVLGYVSPLANTVVVGTSPVSTTVAYRGFFGATFQVAFGELGLPAGTNWSVTVGVPASPVTLASTAVAIAFFEENGTTNFTVSVPAGYQVLPANGSFLVSGANQSVSVAYFKIPATPSPAWSYLSELAYILVGLLAVLMLVGFALAGVYARRSRPAKAPETWTDEGEKTQTEGEGSSPPSGSGPPKT